MGYYEDHTEHRSERPEVYIFYSEESGTGKSYTARRMFPNAYRPPWPTGGRWWWPNYKGEKEVLLDEFRHQISYDKMLQLLDYGGLWIEGKGTNHKCQANVFIITTNIAPWKWYPKKGITGGAMLQRRLKEFCVKENEQDAEGSIFKFKYPMEWYEEGDEDEDGDIIEERRPKPGGS